MAYDYSTAPEQRGIELIPDGTVATLQSTIRPGGAGEDGLLKRSKDGACEMLDLEFVVVDGPQAKRKLWERMVINGVTDGHAKAADISRGKLRAIIESARGISRATWVPEARKGRTVELRDFDGLRFMAKIGVEKGSPRMTARGENYPDRNMIAMVITPDRKDWHAVEQMPRPPGRSPAILGTTVAPITKPAWASK